MPAWLISLGTKLAPLAKWFGLNVLLPWLTELAKKFGKYIKAKTALKKKQSQNAEANQRYEDNPSDDSFGDSP